MFRYVQCAETHAKSHESQRRREMVWTSRHSRLTSDLTLSLTGNVTPGLHIISFESPTLHREDHAAQGVRITPQKQQQSACQICTNACQHKSHHIAICVLQIEYNDRMGRLGKAQNQPRVTLAGEQCVGTPNLQIRLQETPSWFLKVLKLLVCGDLFEDVRSPRLPLQQDLFGNVLDRIWFLQAADHLWRKTETSDVTLSCWPTWEIPKGMLLGTTPGQHVACNETLDVMSFKLSSGRPPWPGQYWCQKTPSRSTNRASKQSRPGQFSNVMRYLSTCVTVNAGSDAQNDCKCSLSWMQLASSFPEWGSRSQRNLEFAARPWAAWTFIPWCLSNGAMQWLPCNFCHAQKGICHAASAGTWAKAESRPSTQN